MFELRKIGFFKRASAWLLDAILLAVLATGFMWIISLALHYSEAEALATQYYNEWDGFRKEYMPSLAPHYGYTYEETERGYTLKKGDEPAALEDVIAELIATEGKEEQTTEAYEAYLALTPAEKVTNQYRYVYTMLFAMVSAGILLAFLVLEFIVPVVLKNGQTVGKKVFGICLVRPDCVKISNLALFARTVVGKYAVETMFPLLLLFLFFFGGLGILAVVLLAALLVLELALLLFTKNKTPIHDIFASTVAADMKEQMIYASEEERNEKLAQLQREAAMEEGTEGKW